MRFNKISKDFRNKSEIIYWGYIIICSTLLAIIQFFTPYSYDDLFYLLPFHDFKEGFIDSLNLDEYPDFFFKHYNSVNGRLTDKLVPLFLLLPKWVFALFTGVIYTYLFYISTQIQKHINKYFKLLLISILVVILPYHEYLFTIAYTINYIFVATLIITIIYYFFSTRSYNKFQRMAIGILSLIASSLHEGFSIPIIISMCIYLLMYHNKITQIQKIIFTTTIIGFSFILLSPGFWFSMHRHNQNTLNTIHFWIYLSIPIAYVIILLFTLIYKKFNNLINTNQKSFIIFTITVIISNITIYIFSIHQYRVFFISIFLGSIAMISILNTIIIFTRPTKRIYTIILTSFIISHLSISIIYQRKYNIEHHKIANLFMESDNGTIFYDILGKNNHPWVCLQKPLDGEFLISNEAWTISNFSKYYGDNNKHLTIIPTSLKKASIANSKLISSSHNIYSTNGLLFSSKAFDSYKISIAFQNDTKSQTTIEFIVKKYINLFDEPFFYLSPLQKWEYNGEQIVFINTK